VISSENFAHLLLQALDDRAVEQGKMQTPAWKLTKWMSG